MARLALTLLITLAGAGAGHAQTPGHRILFPDSTTVSEDDQRAIFGLLGCFCEAVYRWDGTTYQHDHNRPTEPSGCDGVGS